MLPNEIWSHLNGTIRVRTKFGGRNNRSKVTNKTKNTHTRDGKWKVKLKNQFQFFVPRAFIRVQQGHICASCMPVKLVSVWFIRGIRNWCPFKRTRMENRKEWNQKLMSDSGSMELCVHSNETQCWNAFESMNCSIEIRFQK